MGCTVSQVPKSSISQGRKPPVENGGSANGDINHNGGTTHTLVNGHLSNRGSPELDTATDVKHQKDSRNRTLKGDLSQRNEARLKREKTIQDMLTKRELKAQRISDTVMEEKERLSLSTISRSRATSRTGSPRLHRDNHSTRSVPISQPTGDSLRPVTSTLIQPDIGTPDPNPGSSGSKDSLTQQDASLSQKPPRPSALKNANGRRKKGEPKVRILSANNETIHTQNDSQNVSQGHVIVNRTINTMDNKALDISNEEVVL